MNFSFVDYEADTIFSANESSSINYSDIDEEDIKDSIVTAAILTSTAFRMRDDLGLVCALRMLANAVDALESETTV